MPIKSTIKFRITACLVIGAILSFAQPDAFAEQTKSKMDLERARYDALTASRYLKDAMKSQEQIIALKPTVMRNTAIMLAAGLLSTKMNEWGLQEIAEGKKTQKQMMYVSGLAVMRLGQLAQAANLNKAQACHYREGLILIGMSKGKPAEAANCRQEAYPTEMQAESLKEMYRPEMKEIQTLVNDWATNVALLSNSSAKLDGYGTR